MSSKSLPHFVPPLLVMEDFLETLKFVTYFIKRNAVFSRFFTLLFSIPVYLKLVKVNSGR